MADETLSFPPGLVIMTTHGSVTMESVDSWSASRALFAKMGIENVPFQMVHGALVDKARNDAVGQLLSNKLSWILQIDADMMWQPDAPLHLLATAYRDLPWADMVGAWCPLRGFPFLPTIDPGSGTWEPIEPGQGPKEVMRTGGAFVLVKRHVYERMTPPWYGERNAMRPLDALLEIDNYANQKFDGQNPLRAAREWNILERCAMEDAGRGGGGAVVGEDSGFCDRARALGFRIVVNTDVVVQHVDKQIIGPQNHLDAMKQIRQKEAWACGVML